MQQLSFFEKLEILFQNILAHPFFISILLIPIFLIIFNKKITKKAIVLIYIAVLAIILFIGNITIFSLFDNLVDGIFMALYFPNFITLFIVEVLSAIICLITFLKKDITKVSKIINIVGFSIIQTIFALILTVIEANDIDIYQENALYASNDVLTLMQLLMGTFALQIITLLVVKGIEKVTAALDGTDETILNKHTIKLPEGRITHVNLKDKIVINSKEIIKPKETIVKQSEIKPIEENLQKPLNKTILTNNQNINKAIPSQKEKIEVLEPVKPQTQNQNNINPFANFKPEFPIVNDNKSINNNSPQEKQEIIKSKETKKEEKELITNLQIVDFEKMVDAIKNLSIIYTM